MATDSLPVCRSRPATIVGIVRADEARGDSHLTGPPILCDQSPQSGPKIAGRLLSFASGRILSLAILCAIFLVDHAVRWQGLPFVLRALIDEPCHLGTAVVMLGACARWRGRLPDRRFGFAMLSASVFIDVDHLPLAFGSDILTAGTPRPYTHALWLVGALAAVAFITRYARLRRRSDTASQVAAGAALGLCAHFMRDVVTAPISLWWPVSSAGVRLPYGWYVAALLILIATPIPGRVHAKMN